MTELSARRVGAGDGETPVETPREQKIWRHQKTKPGRLTQLDIKFMFPLEQFEIVPNSTGGSTEAIRATNN